MAVLTEFREWVDKRHPLAAWLWVQMRNSRHWHERLMARFLERRGWCVFYLEEHSRECRSLCWLELYKDNKGVKR